MNTIKHVFFDLDNTLWDFRKNARFALDELYKKYDVENRYGFTFEEFHPFYHDSNEGLWALIRDKKITKEEKKILIEIEKKTLEKKKHEEKLKKYNFQHQKNV